MNPGAVGGHPQGSPSLKTPTVHIRVCVCLLPGPRPHPRCEGFRSVSPAQGWESFGALWAVATRGQHDSPTVRSQSSLQRLCESPGGGGGGDPTTHHRHHHLGVLTAAQEALWGGWHPRKLPVLKVWPSNVVSSPSPERPKWIPRAEPL